MRVMDVFFSFPATLLALGIVAALGPHPANVMLAIAVVYTPIFARVVRPGPRLEGARVRRSEPRAGAPGADRRPPSSPISPRCS
jgi:hypothetical protein